jgi:twitching motility protein PilT
MDITELLRYAVEMGASDLHLKAGNVPYIRVDGQLRPTSFESLTPVESQTFAAQLMPDHKMREFAATNEADFGYTLPGVGRFRVNAFRQRGNVGLAIRRVRAEVPTFEELLLPPVMKELADSSRGLVLLTGPTGTGKTTSIASVIGYINRTRRAHIVTIEDPIEVVHEDDLSIIQQREIGLDTESYGNALRHVIRQDPDVVFIGEIRDPESALSGIQAAETGHLVISTMHTIDATETINRLLDLFPPTQQREVRTSFAGALRGIVSQRLVPRADGKGRVPAVEVMISTGRIYERIIDPESTIEIRDVIAEGTYYGMQTFDQALVKMVKDGLINEDDGRRASTTPHDFNLALRGVMTRGTPQLI